MAPNIGAKKQSKTTTITRRRPWDGAGRGGGRERAGPRHRRWTRAARRRRAAERDDLRGRRVQLVAVRERVARQREGERRRPRYGERQRPFECVVAHVDDAKPVR